MTRSGRHPCIVRLGIWHRALDTRDIAKKLATESAEAVSDSANGHSLRYASRKSVKGIPAQVDAKAANSTVDKTGSASGVINALPANVPASPTARLFLWLRTPYIAHVPGVSFGGNHDQDIRVAD
jgi:hypothetical protein